MLLLLRWAKCLHDDDAPWFSTYVWHFKCTPQRVANIIFFVYDQNVAMMMMILCMIMMMMCVSDWVVRHPQHHFHDIM